MSVTETTELTKRDAMLSLGLYSGYLFIGNRRDIGEINAHFVVDSRVEPEINQIKRSIFRLSAAKLQNFLASENEPIF